MARKRMLDPHIWEDPSFNNISIEARLLFIGMISNADDEGYIRGDAGSLKRLIFGFDNIDSDTMEDTISQLKGVRSIHFFEYDNEWFAHLLNWNEYQKQQKDRIQASVYPKCSKCVAGEPPLLKEVKLSKDKLDKDNTNILATDVAVKNDINSLIALFEPINPTFERLYSNKSQRLALERMVSKYGTEKIGRAIQSLAITNVQQYAPVITTPVDLEKKMGALIAFIGKKKTEKTRTAEFREAV